MNCLTTQRLPYTVTAEQLGESPEMPKHHRYYTHHRDMFLRRWQGLSATRLNQAFLQLQVQEPQGGSSFQQCQGLCTLHTIPESSEHGLFPLLFVSLKNHEEDSRGFLAPLSLTEARNFPRIFNRVLLLRSLARTGTQCGPGPYDTPHQMIGHNWVTCTHLD